MFAISERVRPCSARSSPRSVVRLTTTELSCISPFIPAGTCWFSSPSGPFTITRPGEIDTDTPGGSSIGCRPIRLTGSPDEADDLAADAALGGGARRDQAVGRGQDCRAHPTEDAREAVLAGIDAAAGLGDALEIGDHTLAVAAELEVDHERVVSAVLLLVLLARVVILGADDPVVADVALLLEEAGDVRLQARARDLHALVERAVRVLDPREHVCDWVCLHATRPGFHNLKFACPLLLPARFRHARDYALVGEVAQADPAEAELLVDGARPPAPVAPRVVAHFELLR